MFRRDHSCVWSSYEIVERILELEGEKKTWFFGLSIPTCHLNDLEEVVILFKSVSSPIK